MAYRWGNIVKSITGLEIQPPLAHLARKNMTLNGFYEFCRIITGDVTRLLQYVKRESFSRVACNPPFYKDGTGRTNRNRESLHARHQILGTLEDFVFAAAAAVKNGGSTYFVYPAEGLTDLLVLNKKHKLEPKQIRLIYSYPHPDKSAKLVLVKSIKNGGDGVAIMPPFYVYTEKNGGYSADMENYYRE
jgi:tRNA1Val (adenine37-N6)-methyltransferase